MASSSTSSETKRSRAETSKAPEPKRQRNSHYFSEEIWSSIPEEAQMFILQAEKELDEKKALLNELRAQDITIQPAPSFRFPPFEDPKKASTNILKALSTHQDSSLRPIYSPLAWAFLAQIYSTIDDDDGYQAAKGIVDSCFCVLQLATTFRDSIISNHENWNAALAAALNKLMHHLSPSMNCVAMSPLASTLKPGATPQLDIGVVHVFEGKLTIPFVIGLKMRDNLEGGLERNSRYCCNFSRSGIRPHYLSVVIAFPQLSEHSRSLTINVQLLLPMTSANSSYASFFPMTLYSNTVTEIQDQPAAIARLLLAICRTCNIIDGSEFPQVLEYEQHFASGSGRIPVTAWYGNTVIKVYHQSVENAYDRRPYLYPRLFEGAKIEVDTPAVKVVTYPKLEGEIIAGELNPLHLLSAAEDLKRIYDLGVAAHADIRLANLIVSPSQTPTARWIDFDYSVEVGEEGRRIYPPGWVTELKDTTRHHDAQAGEPILRSHDLFSFSKLLLCYEPEITEHRETWEKLSQDLENCASIEEIIECLGQVDGTWKLNSKIERSKKD